MTALPSEVRFVRLGRDRRWERVSFERGQLHAGWSEVPDKALLQVDRQACRAAIDDWFASQSYKSDAARKGAATRDFKQLMDLIEQPDQFVWVTISKGRLWWCTVKRGAAVNPEGVSGDAGHFWLTCDRGWSDRSLKDIVLNLADLPGAVGVISGFRGTVARPQYADAILRAISGERRGEVSAFDAVSRSYLNTVKGLLPLLHWRDFELLTDLIFARGGWVRTSQVGGTKETLDIEAEHPETGERAMIQVKAAAGQSELDDYIQEWEEMGYHRLFFVVARPQGSLHTSRKNVHVWMPEKIANLVARRGLADWVVKHVA